MNMSDTERKDFILKHLRLAGTNVRQLSIQIDRSETSVHRVINGISRSAYIEKHIATICNSTIEELFGAVSRRRQLQP